jgi:hypothetical protein
MKRLRPLIATMAWCVACALALPQAHAQHVTVMHLDGRELFGMLSRLDAETLAFEDADGPQRVPLDDIAHIEFTDCTPRADRDQAARFHLAEGGTLNGVLVDGSAEQVVARTQVAERTELKYADLAAVQLRRDDTGGARALFDAALAARLPGTDVLIALDDDGAKSLRGRLAELGPEEGAFVFGDRPRRFRTSRVYGVVLAKGAGMSARAALEVELDSGDRFSAENPFIQEGTLHVTATFGQKLHVPIERVCRLRVHSDRVIYLSGLRGKSESSYGILHPAWPIVRDANVMRQPITLGGRTFARGIGVHARAQITFALDGAYETFAATIGIDDAVGDGGNAEFIVLGDGKELFASGSMLGGDAPRAVSVPIAGIDELTLIVEPGANADVGDWANWADARVIRPRDTR